MAETATRRIPVPGKVKSIFMNEIVADPLVSIVVRTCNRPFLLSKALSSISGQRYRPLEVIIVDDGNHKINTDFIRDFDPSVDITYLKTDCAGRSGAGNAGIAHAKGAFIVFLDDDDELYPDHISGLVNVLLEEGAEVAYADSEMSFDAYDPGVKTLEPQIRYVKFSEDFNKSLLLFRNYIPLMCLCFSKKAIQSAGGFNETLDLFEDWDLLIRLAITHGYEFIHLAQTTAKYRQWGNRQGTSTDTEVQEKSYLRVVSQYIDDAKPTDFYRVFKYTDQKLDEVVERNLQLAALKQELAEKEAVRDNRHRILAEISRSCEEGLALGHKTADLETTCERLRVENERLTSLNTELETINRMYVEENLRKEAHIAKLEKRAAAADKESGSGAQ